MSLISRTTRVRHCLPTDSACKILTTAKGRAWFAAASPWSRCHPRHVAPTAHRSRGPRKSNTWCSVPAGSAFIGSAPSPNACRLPAITRPHYRPLSVAPEAPAVRTPNESTLLTTLNTRDATGALTRLEPPRPGPLSLFKYGKREQDTKGFCDPGLGLRFPVSRRAAAFLLCSLESLVLGLL